MKTKFYFFSAMMLLASCSQNEEGVGQLETISNDSMSQMYIDCNKDVVNINDAKKVAILFNSTMNDKNGKTRISDSRQDAKISTINDQRSGQPLLYVANYGKNNGFAIISSTKNTKPIFAYSQEGHFNLDSITGGVSSFIDAYKAEVKVALADASDSLRVKHALEWARFEKEVTSKKASTRSVDQAMIQQEIQKMTAQGYTYIGDITTLQYYYSPSEYQQIVQNVVNNAHPDYNYLDYTLFFLKYVEPYNIDPLINVQWHQFEPFNYGASNGIAGCVPVAVAQILYYYKYPNTFNWNQIYADPSSNINNTSFYTFIQDVRDECDVTYNSNSTSSNINKAKDALEHYGYSVTKYDYFTTDILANSIIVSKPLYLQGEEGSVGHAWICEGYKRSEYLASLSMIRNRPLVQYTESPLDSWQLNKYFYMAFGQSGGAGNGWYSYSSLSDTYPDDRKCLVISR